MTAALDGGINVTRGCDNYGARSMPEDAHGAPHDDADPDPDSDERVTAFVATLAARSVHTRRAYRHDVAEFATWCGRGGCPDLAALDHRALRRYLAYLQSRGFARTTIARKAAAVRAYVRYLRRTGVVTRDVSLELRAPKVAKKLPRFPRAAEAASLIGAAEAGAELPVDEGVDPAAQARGASRSRGARAAVRRRIARERMLRARRH